MLASNPIWYREQQAWKARVAALPRWRRPLRYVTLSLIWGATGLLCAIMLELTDNFSDHPVRQAVEMCIIFSYYLQLAYLLFRSLIAGASSVVRERELQTLDTLLSSPMPAGTLLAGKWMVAAIPLLLEIAVVLPLAFALQQWSAHESEALLAWQLGDLTLFSVALVMAMTGLGIFISTRSRNSGKASTQAVMTGLFLSLGTYLVDVIIQVFRGAPYITPYLCRVNPFTAFWAIWGLDYGLHRGNIHRDLWQGSIAIYTVVALAAAYLACQRLRRSTSL